MPIKTIVWIQYICYYFSNEAVTLPVKLTKPLTAILYVSDSRQHLVQLRKVVHHVETPVLGKLTSRTCVRVCNVVYFIDWLLWLRVVPLCYIYNNIVAQLWNKAIRLFCATFFHNCSINLWHKCNGAFFTFTLQPRSDVSILFSSKIAKKAFELHCEPCSNILFAEWY